MSTRTVTNTSHVGHTPHRQYESALTTPEPKTSLSPGIRKTEKNKMFKQAQASVGTTMVVANPLFDEHGVEPREYDVLQPMLEETGRAKPRRRVLFVDMPSAIHEAPFTKLKISIASTLDLFPYDHKLICSTLEMNLPLEIEGESVMPDICVTMSKGNGASEELLVPLIGECVCSETVAHALKKMKDTISVHPEIDMAILGIVREVKPYHCPRDGSLASVTLLNSPKPMARRQFITKRFPPCTSVNIAGHSWCHLCSVEYLVWVKQDGEAQIDLDNCDEEHMARGTLFPDIAMDAVTNMIQRGLKKIKDTFVAYTQRLDGTADITRLQEAEVAFSIDWEDSIRAMNIAVESISHARYKHWHENAQFKTGDEPECIKAGKRTRDRSYSPSEADFAASDETNLRASTSRSRGRPKRKRRPASQPPPRKSK
ncbi:hypothetical protein BDR04DRAFT_1164226 [Suillus decipiens]|nr:hypothetical protein BDR04DRAFT_1164226 [Suillus decipiens]